MIIMSGTQNMIECCKTKNKEALDSCGPYPYHPRKCILELKNDVESLQFLLDNTGCGSCGSGGYFFTDIKDPYTFYLYDKYGVDNCNLDPYKLGYGHWLYLTKIGFVGGCWEDFDDEGKCHCGCDPYEVETQHIVKRLGRTPNQEEIEGEFLNLDGMVESWIKEHEQRND